MEGVNRAECLNRERGERDGGGEEKIPDLCGAVQNAADELDQLLHGVDGLTGQEVLLVGCVEDDDRGHRHLAEKRGDRKGSFLIFSTSAAARAAVIKAHH